MRAIWVLSDVAYQERFWIKGERPVMRIGNWTAGVLDFKETLIFFFENYIKAKESLEAEITRLNTENLPIRNFLTSQLNFLNELHDKLLDFKRCGRFKRIVFDTRWHEIIISAKSLYKELSREPTIEEIYPEFICNLQRQSDDNQNFPWFFSNLVGATWKLSSKDYQERFWVASENSYSDFEATVDQFEEAAEILFDTSDNNDDGFKMSPKQRKMLQEFYDMMEEYQDGIERWLNNAVIIEDPKFAKCREYARIFYKELLRVDLANFI